MGALSDTWGGGRKLGRNYYGGTYGSDYKAQSLRYKRALRQLDYAARRAPKGDTRHALAAIKVRNEANAEGFTPGGIQSRNEFMGGMRDDYKAKQAAGDRFQRSTALQDLNQREEAGFLEDARRRREEEERRRKEGVTEQTEVYTEKPTTPEKPKKEQDDWGTKGTQTKVGNAWMPEGFLAPRKLGGKRESTLARI